VTALINRVGDVNVAEALVSKGFASVVRYREGDDDRATCFDDLLAAESRCVVDTVPLLANCRAQKGQKGMHSKELPVHRINDVASRAVAEKLLPGFQRAGRVAGVVEHVQSGSRLRVFVPKDSCIVTFLLAGLSCPRSSGGDRPGEPFGDEALAFARSLALQREVCCVV
jgi:staphylococcal nuclease domain-containing protein 1